MANTTRDILLNALDFCDKFREKNYGAMLKYKYIEFIRDIPEIEPGRVRLYDHDKKFIRETTYEIIGIFYNLPKLWIWSWAVMGLKKNTTNLTRKVLNYGVNLDDKSDSSLKTELITSRLKILNNLRLVFHLSVFAYITKKSNIVSYRSYNKEQQGHISSYIELYSPLVEPYNKKKDDDEDFNEYFLVLTEDI